jgi:copper homeostasis protein
MPRTLEVIVTNLYEAIEAERGGADRVELVRSLEVGGLTPSAGVVEAVTRTLSIPVRVMLRENPSMMVGTEDELHALQEGASLLAQLPIGGFVLGFVRDGSVDLTATRKILARAPDRPATFHRAFEHVRDPLRAIRELKQIPQIDRILTTGGEGSWAERKKRLSAWQEAASPEISILVGAGVCAATLADIASDAHAMEVHVGRAARIPQTVEGIVDRERVASLKSLFS